MLTLIVRIVMVWILVIGLVMSFYIARDVLDDIKWVVAKRREKKLGRDLDQELFDNVEEFRHDFE